MTSNNFSLDLTEEEIKVIDKIDKSKDTNPFTTEEQPILDNLQQLGILYFDESKQSFIITKLGTKVIESDYFQEQLQELEEEERIAEDFSKFLLNPYDLDPTPTGNTLEILRELYDNIYAFGVAKLGLALQEVFDYITLSDFLRKLENLKIKENLKRNLDSYMSKLHEIPKSDFCSVETDKGIPIVERLLYTTNEKVSELLVNLLLNSTSIKTSEEIRPAFLHTLDRLNSSDIETLKLLRERDTIPYITMRISDPREELRSVSFYSELEHDIDFMNPNDLSPHIDTFVDAGIISSNFYETEDISSKDHKRLSETYSVDLIENEIKEASGEFKATGGYIKITAYGKSFIRACTFGKLINYSYERVDYQSLIRVNQVWRRGNEYFKISRFEDNEFTLLTNILELNPFYKPEVQISSMYLLAFLMNQQEDFELESG